MYPYSSNTVLLGSSMGENVHKPKHLPTCAAAFELSAQLDADVLVFEWPGFGHTQMHDGTLLKSLCCCCGHTGCLCVQTRTGSCWTDETAVREVLLLTLAVESAHFYLCLFLVLAPLVCSVKQWSNTHITSTD